MKQCNSLGVEGETAASVYLERAGLKILARRFRCQGGELDIVAADKGALVFVEVKARAGSGFGGAVSAVTPAKQKRLAVAALTYIKENNLRPESVRFDVVTLTASLPPEHIKNAFTPGRFSY